MTVRARSTASGHLPSAADARAQANVTLLVFLVFLGACDTHAPSPSRRNAQVFVPLLVDDLANTFAWSRHSTARPESCASFEDDAVQTNCVQCVEGDGEQIRSVDPVSGAVTCRGPALAGAPRRYQPDVLHLHDDLHLRAVPGDRVHHRRQPRGLRELPPARARRIVPLGACACCAFIVLPFSASLYWLGGLLIMLSNISLRGFRGVLQLVPAAHGGGQRAGAGRGGGSEGRAGDDDVYKAREAANSEYSSKGQMWGYVGGTTCLVLSVVVVAVCSMVLSAS